MRDVSQQGRLVCVASASADLRLRRRRPRAQTFARHVVVAQEGHAAEIGREVLGRGERVRRGGRDGLCAGGDAPGGRATSAAAGSWSRSWPTVARSSRSTSASRPRRPRPSGCTSARTEARSRTTAPGRARRVCRGRFGGSAWPMPGSARPAGPTWSGPPPGWLATASRSPETLARSLNAQLFERGSPRRRRTTSAPARPPRRLPRVRRRLPQARRLPLARRRPPRPARPGRDPRPDRGARARTSSTTGRTARADRGVHGRRTAA